MGQVPPRPLRRERTRPPRRVLEVRDGRRGTGSPLVARDASHAGSRPTPACDAQRSAPARGESQAEKLSAPLAATRREDGTAGAGAHAQTETVHLGPAPVVRLKSPLGHGDSLVDRSAQWSLAASSCPSRPTGRVSTSSGEADRSGRPGSVQRRVARDLETVRALGNGVKSAARASAGTALRSGDRDPMHTVFHTLWVTWCEQVPHRATMDQ